MRLRDAVDHSEDRGQYPCRRNNHPGTQASQSHGATVSLVHVRRNTVHVIASAARVLVVDWSHEKAQKALSREETSRCHSRLLGFLSCRSRWVLLSLHSHRLRRARPEPIGLPTLLPFARTSEASSRHSSTGMSKRYSTRTPKTGAVCSKVTRRR